jgi:hypothetical protein
MERNDGPAVQDPEGLFVDVDFYRVELLALYNVQCQELHFFGIQVMLAHQIETHVLDIVDQR